MWNGGQWQWKIMGNEMWITHNGECQQLEVMEADLTDNYKW